jgi:hypothetical protein
MNNCFPKGFVTCVISFITASSCIAGNHDDPSIGSLNGRCPSPINAATVRLLIVTGGHPYEPSEFFQAFGSMKDIKYDHVSLEDGHIVSVPPGGLGHYDVVLFYDYEMREQTPEWLDLLKKANGLVFLHHALGSFPHWAGYNAIVGGHAYAKDDTGPLPDKPDQVWELNVKQEFTVVDREHPITCGIKSFTMVDELYDNFEVDPKAHILMTSAQHLRTPPAAWTWTYNGKRVVYLQPGHGVMYLPLDHGATSYQNRIFLRILNRSIMWSAGRL